MQQVAPELVAEDASTTLLSVKYGDIQWLVVQALQELIAKVNDLANTVAGFAETFTTNELTFTRATGTELSVQQLNTGELCANKTDGTSVCVTGDELAAFLAQAGGAATPGAASLSVPAAGSPGPTNAASTTAIVAAGEGQPPVIQINGENPAIVSVGDTYNDLGATIVSTRRRQEPRHQDVPQWQACQRHRDRHHQSRHRHDRLCRHRRGRAHRDLHTHGPRAAASRCRFLDRNLHAAGVRERE